MAISGQKAIYRWFYCLPTKCFFLLFIFLFFFFFSFLLLLISLFLLFRNQSMIQSSAQIFSECLYMYTTTTTKLLQSCPTLCDPTDGSPPGSPIPGILQARILEWIAISFSNIISLTCGISLTCRILKRQQTSDCNKKIHRYRE